MKRSLMIAAAVLSTFAGTAPAAKADDGPVYNAARCRRHVPCCTRTYYVPRPNVYQYQRNTWINSSQVNVFPRYTPLAKAPAFFLGTPAPQYQTPVNGPDMTPGRTYTLKVSYLLENPGYVNLYIGNTSHSCNILHWGPNEVTFEVPNLGVIATGVAAQVEVARPDGFVALRRAVDLVNPPDLIEHEEPAPGSTAGQFGGPMLMSAAGG
jgi:hypothetical protein